jgi:hypothetical protein
VGISPPSDPDQLELQNMLEKYKEASVQTNPVSGANDDNISALNLTSIILRLISPSIPKKS